MKEERHPSPPQGWFLVTKHLEDARAIERGARTEEEFRKVGEKCAETLLLLVQAAYVLDRKQFGNDARVSLADSIVTLLQTFISSRLHGAQKDAALASLQVAAQSLGKGIQDAKGAELCLAATSAVVGYLPISVERRRSRETIADLSEKFLKDVKGDVLDSQGYSIQAVMRMPIARRVAGELTEEDVIDHIKRRRDEGLSAATAMHDITNLRVVFLHARERYQLDVSTDVIDRAKRVLRESGLIGTATKRDRRPTREELQRLVDYFETPSARGKARVIPMQDLMDFALWTARRISEICELRWADLDLAKRTLKTRVTDATGNTREHVFPVAGKAMEIINRQRGRVRQGEEKIFPYNAKSCSAAYTLAKKRLGIEGLRFHDFRREAAVRLRRSGYSVEEIAKVTGRLDLTTLLKDVEASMKEEPNQPPGRLTADAN